MPNRETKRDMIAYFIDKRNRSVQEDDNYHETVVEILDLLNSTDDNAAIKSRVRSLH